MMKYVTIYNLVIPGLLLLACNNGQRASQAQADSSTHNDKVTAQVEQDQLPPPNATPSVKNFSKVIDLPAGKTPTAPAGFKVSLYADSLENPRWIYVLPNGDVLVAEANTVAKGINKIKNVLSGKSKSQDDDASANRITLLRDTDHDGKPDRRFTFLKDIDRPFGMLLLKNTFYAAGTGGVWQFPYTSGQTNISAAGKKIMDLPVGGYNNHWTRNLLANAAGSKIYVTVGSGSNVYEHGAANEVRRANILEINPDGSGERVYASGLRNPVGMALAPGTQQLWAVVNERDELGDELVPDYLTSVQDGGFYGWPWVYMGNHPDPRLKDSTKPAQADHAIVPDVPLVAHSASLGLAFYDKKVFPAKYQGGAFIGQHGSWNRSQLVGYRVMFVPFQNGKPSGQPEDFLTGFIADPAKSEVYGRPVGIAVLPDGSLLVADDAGHRIWKISAAG